MYVLLFDLIYSICGSHWHLYDHPTREKSKSVLAYTVIMMFYVLLITGVEELSIVLF